eukprot:SAG11_NODE_186_length_13142_cov_17.515679_1_plen_94_part_00
MCLLHEPIKGTLCKKTGVRLGWRKASPCPETAGAISGQVPCAAASATMGGTSVITLVPVQRQITHDYDLNTRSGNFISTIRDTKFSTGSLGKI